MWWTLSAVAATWNIPGDYPDITSAVNSGVLTAGDTLLLAPGPHAGYHFISMPISGLILEGVSPSAVLNTPTGGEDTVIRSTGFDLEMRNLTVDGQGVARGVDGDQSTLTLTDVTIIAGASVDTLMGGGLRVGTNSTAVLTGVDVRDSTANLGAGIGVESTGTLDGVLVTLDNNASTGFGGGVYADGIAEFDNSFFANNLAQHGGALYALATTTLNNSTFQYNSAEGGHGGAISGESEAAVDIADCTFLGNEADSHGGSIAGELTLDVDRTYFGGGYSDKGGAVYLSGITVEQRFHNVAFCGNQAITTGHAFFYELGSNVIVFNTLFAFNGIDSAVTVDGHGTMSIENALFHSNPAPYAMASSGQLDMHGTIFSGSGLQAFGGTGSVSVNVFAPDALLEGTPSPSNQIFADPSIVDPVGCDPQQGYPYASAPATLDVASSTLDIDGSLADAGQLGGTSLDVDFWHADEDGDQSRIHIDCDDDVAEAFPGNTEICDGIDNDCDGEIDEAGGTVYVDGDSDGYGDVAVDGCAGVGNLVDQDGDCNDGHPGINPGASDTTCDGVDNDCDLDVDEGAPTTPWYPDTDGDSYGDREATPLSACAQPVHHVANHQDCDDADGQISPDASEECDAIDHDCDDDPSNGVVFSDWFLDGDGDGFGSGSAVSDCLQPAHHVLDSQDCDDGDDSTFPGAPEQCDPVDHNCNGPVDDGVTTQDWYLDSDGDGFGTGPAVSDCATVPGHSLTSGDCEDGDDAIHPDADETCDGIDNDCDSDVDDDDSTVSGAPLWYPDLDDDSYGDDLAGAASCIAPADWIDRAGDCDDQEPNVYVGAPEACVDHLDNDCDGLIDDADPDYSFLPVEYGYDADDDGYAAGDFPEVACAGAQSPGYVPLDLGIDCDDGNDQINPGEVEACDNIDNDCFGGIDNGLLFSDYFVDNDGDAFGDPASVPVNDCIAAPGRVGNALDCDDADPLRNPNATEVCNEIDDDCDGPADEDLPSEDYFPDADLDGFGDALATAVTSCATVPHLILDNTDCDDADRHIYPGATEDPIDGIDSDCGGEHEEIPVIIPDTDGDGIPDSIDVNPASAGDAPRAPLPTPVDYGCGCSNGGASGGAVLLLAGLLGVRRRS